MKTTLAWTPTLVGAIQTSTVMIIRDKKYYERLPDWSGCRRHHRLRSRKGEKSRRAARSANPYAVQIAETINDALNGQLA